MMGCHKFPTKKTCCFQGKFVCSFYMVFFCCSLFQTWIFSQWWTLNLTKPRFFGGKPEFLLLLVDCVFSSKRQAYATIEPRGSLLQKRFRLSGRRPWGPAILDFSIKESCRFPKPMVGPMGEGGW